MSATSDNDLLPIATQQDTRIVTGNTTELLCASLHRALGPWSVEMRPHRVDAACFRNHAQFALCCNVSTPIADHGPYYCRE